MTRRIGWLARSLPLTVTALLLSSAPAQAGPPKPPAGHHTFQWLAHKCVETPEGFRTIGQIRTHVLRLEKPSKRHFQKVRIQVDRLAGYGDASATWRKVQARTWDWGHFTGNNVPTYSTSAIRTGMQPDTATLSIKATVTLYRVRKLDEGKIVVWLPNKKVWRYEERSPSFTCGEEQALAPRRNIGART